jgi:hypothetical protein
METVNHRFTTAKGNSVVVVVVRSVSRNVTGMVGFSRNANSKEAFAVVNGTHRVPVNPGATFEAHSRVVAAGF